MHGPSTVIVASCWPSPGLFPGSDTAVREQSKRRAEIVRQYEPTLPGRSSASCDVSGVDGFSYRKEDFDAPHGANVGEGQERRREIVAHPTTSRLAPSSEPHRSFGAENGKPPGDAAEQ
ncbi:hypothetical protein PG997_004972 [Apiospora hydei]|uniref:Uncharacterized protein n=1 Tax=Apiospora hydei TaxID=1337664 RepID=A0ABR1X3P6_9PEZI